MQTLSGKEPTFYYQLGIIYDFSDAIHENVNEAMAYLNLREKFWKQIDQNCETQLQDFYCL